MPRASLDRHYLKLDKGLITEATSLNFPEGALADESNLVIDHTGKVSRRRGLSYTEDYTTDGVATENDIDIPVFSYLWRDAVSTTDILVLRVTRKISFYRMDKDSLSAGYIDSIDLSYDEAVSDITVSESRDSLLICTGSVRVVTVEFTEPDTITLDVEQLSDFQVREDRIFSEEGEEYTNPITDDLKADLINQGWPEKNIPWFYRFDTGSAYTFKKVPRKAFRNVTGFWPTIYDNYAYYFDTGRHGFDESPVVSRQGSNTLAPRGHTIRTFSSFSPTSAVFYQGHAVYAAVTESSSFNTNTLFISQTLKDDSFEEYTKCFSKNDPTDIYESSPLDTDGGKVTINDAANIKYLWVLGDSLVVFASNGIWSLSPANDTIFTVNSFVLKRISEESLASTSSVVEHKGSLFFFGDKSIFTIGRNELGDLTVRDLSETTIQTFYNELNTLQKYTARGVVSRDEFKVHWLYDSRITSSENDIRFMDSALILDLRTGAFTTHKFNIDNGDNSQVMTAFSYENASSSITQNSVVVIEDQVLAGVEEVEIGVSSTQYGEEGEILNYVTLLPYNGATWGIRLATATSTDFVDLADSDEDFDGWAYDSYMETGPINLGDPSRDKQATYTFCYFDRTEENFILDPDDGVSVVFDNPSSCLMRYKWDWTGSATANKWSDSSQVYRLRRNYTPAVPPAPGVPVEFDYGHNVIDSKNKVRGSGKALRVRFESETGKDFQMLGWSTSYTAGSAQ